MNRISGRFKYWVKNPVKKQVRNMDENQARRWLVMVDEGHWILYDNEEDIQEWDTILEIVLPREMALMLDYTQHAYFQMQGYFEAQWKVMQSKLQEDEPVYDEGVNGDNVTFDRLFEGIVKENKLDELGKEEE